MSLNLVRNSRVFFTTNVNQTTGVINASSVQAFNNTNTFELQVLDGFSFSQNVNNETVTVSEAGSAPTRGQRNFNTSLAPVDFSMSTYIRPSQLTTSPYTVQCDESVLWNALMSDQAITSTIGSATATTVSVSYAQATGQLSFTGSGAAPNLTYSNFGANTAPVVGEIVNIGGLLAGGDILAQKKLNGPARVITSSANSLVVQLLDPYRTAVGTVSLATANTFNISRTAWFEGVRANDAGAFSSASSALSEKNQLQKFGLLFLVDTVLYAVDNCALNQVTIDFGLDQIATAQWTGQATALRELSRAVRATTNSFTGGTSTDVGSGTFKQPITTANYITNKLSTASLKALKAIGTNIAADDTYSVALTGGSITINNNITYITPAILGVVNTPVTYFTGVRSVSGNVTCYLRTPATGGSTSTGELFKDMIAEASAASTAMIEPMFEMGIQIGGSSSAVRVELDMPTVSLGIPSVNVEQIVSLSINFNAQGYAYNSTQASQTFDLTQPNELRVLYFA